MVAVQCSDGCVVPVASSADHTGTKLGNGLTFFKRLFWDLSCCLREQNQLVSVTSQVVCWNSVHCSDADIKCQWQPRPSGRLRAENELS